MTEQKKWNSKESMRRQYNLESEFSPRQRIMRWIGRQIWLPRGRDFLLRLLWNPDMGVHYLFEINFFGQRYRGDLAHYIDWVVFCYGAAPYSELSLLEEMASEIRSQRTAPLNFVDIGANAGHHTLFMAKIADSVLAVEPFPALQSLIREKIALNDLQNVRLAPIALGYEDGVLDYYPGAGANSGVGTFLPDSTERKVAPIKLEVRRGDDFFDELGLGRIDLIKIDVEGFEPLVFRGMKNRIENDRPVILMEMSDASREYFGSEESFRNTFYAGARFCAVKGRLGHRFSLRRFSYERSEEILIVPPEMGQFVERRVG
jgi:FkbM family methyltransferase